MNEDNPCHAAPIELNNNPRLYQQTCESIVYQRLSVILVFPVHNFLRYNSVALCIRCIDHRMFIHMNSSVIVSSYSLIHLHVDGLAQDCGNSSASAIMLPHFCTKASTGGIASSASAVDANPPVVEF